MIDFCRPAPAIMPQHKNWLSHHRRAWLDFLPLQLLFGFAATIAPAVAGTISVPTDFTGAFVIEKSDFALGQTFRVPAPVGENILSSLTLNLFGGPFDANEPDPVTFAYSLEVWLFDTGKLSPTGSALFSSGPQLWVAGTNVPVINSVTFSGLKLALDPAAMYALIFRPGNDTDSFTFGQIHQNLSAPYNDGFALQALGGVWNAYYSQDLSFSAQFVASAVPEPVTACLTAVGLALLLRTRHCGPRRSAESGT